MLSDVVELLSYAAFIVAGWLIVPWLGVAVLGAVLWYIAQAMHGEKDLVIKVKVPKVPRIRVKPPRVTPPKAAGAGERAR